MVQIEVAGQALVLLPERAAFLPAENALLVADAHLGKAQSFRSLGVPVPAGTTSQTLEALDAALARTGAGQVIFLGDLIHSSRSRTPGTAQAVARWRARHPGLALTLVRGNHDRHAGDPPPDWGIDCVDGPLRFGALALAHEPEPIAGAYVIGGHLHPAASLGGPAHDRLRLPCFHFGHEVGVLPAFGAFTGCATVERRPGDRTWVVVDDSLRPLHSVP
ncbi:DNA ligase-associated metallophosphoesterase [Rubrivivax gelatinosus]|uniref:ligase-associated DNA damage response endonuclease PdeM n=1 Tax=Rubrivivax gelatinosus TaxID=28068 RepID=UPI0018CA1EE0|nr:ligase-associated DNA damage response endonuclease PdeM [Rubrivivax gelatinosus]MBG6080983.1 DNA ligase-associated metallophosphoesterase [Rubrivivax gelatinosus]